MSNFRFGIGLLVALTLHATMNKLSPNSLAFFNPYLILVIYYALGWRLVGVIFAGVAAGLVEDAFTISIPGLHAFTLTLVDELTCMKPPFAFKDDRASSSYPKASM